MVLSCDACGSLAASYTTTYSLVNRLSSPPFLSCTAPSKASLITALQENPHTDDAFLKKHKIHPDSKMATIKKKVNVKSLAIALRAFGTKVEAVKAAAAPADAADAAASDASGLAPIESLTPDLEALIAAGEMTREEARAVAFGGDAADAKEDAKEEDAAAAAAADVKVEVAAPAAAAAEQDVAGMDLAPKDYDFGASACYDGLARRITCANEEARRLWARAYGFMINYNHEYAVAQFQACLAADPKCAMAWWGIGYCVSSNYNWEPGLGSSYDALQVRRGREEEEKRGRTSLK